MSIHSAPYFQIIETLVEARKSLSMTQSELAEVWGKSQPQITKIEQRERRLDVQEFLELCMILNVDPTEVIRRAHNMLKAELLKGAAR